MDGEKSGRRPPPDDDGRVIADMDVPGMPWHDARLARLRRFGAAARGARGKNRERLTGEDLKVMLKSSVLASLAVAGLYILALAALILFLFWIW